MHLGGSKRNINNSPYNYIATYLLFFANNKNISTTMSTILITKISGIDN